LQVTTARGGSWFASTVRNYDLRISWPYYKHALKSKFLV
jgi:hypothetical protein